MTSLFGGGPKLQMPSPPPPPATTVIYRAPEQTQATVTNPAAAAAAQNAADQELAVLAKAKGRAATLLTGGQGDTSEAPVAQKTLLGA